MSLSSAPILRSISYLGILSTLSESSFNARIAAQVIRKTNPMYKPRNVTIAPKPMLAAAMCALVLIL